MVDNKGFYGWTVTAGLVIIYLSSCGTYGFAFGVFLPRIVEDMGWLSGDLSLAFSIHTWIFLALGPVVGWSIARFGARRNLLLGNLLIVLGLVAFSFVDEVWHVYLAYGVLGGVGLGFAGLYPCMVVVTHWFIRRRALVMGIVAAAGGVGGLAFPPLITSLASGIGWRPSLLVMAGIHLVLSVIIGGWLVRGKPADVGQVPDGIAARVDETTGLSVAPPSRVHQATVDWKVGPAMRQPTTWLIIGMVIFILFVASIIQVHQQAYVEVAGFDKMAASTVLSVLLGMSILGRLAFGAMALRFEVRYLIAGFFALRVVALLVLINTTSLMVFYLYAVLSGIGYGGLLIARSTILSSYYGATDYAKISGWVSLAGVIGALGAFAAGKVYDWFDSYLWIMVVAIGFSAIGIALALLARPPRPPATD
ncbi:MAG: MFS transporter [Chloroflexota bacterium]